MATTNDRLMRLAVEIRAFVTVLVMTSFCSLAIASLERPPPEVAATFKTIGIEKTLEIITSQLSKNNGKAIDQSTIQLSVSSNGRNLNTTFQALVDKSKTDVGALKSALIKKSEAMTCTAPINVMLITDMGAIYTTHYYDINSLYLFSITIDRNSCVKFK